MDQPAHLVWLRTALTLALGMAGALGAWWIGLPVPWLTGSVAIIAVTALSGRTLLGGPPVVHPTLIIPIFIAIGLAAGSAVTPEALARVGQWPMSIVALIVAVPLITLSGTLVLRIAGWDKGSAYLGSVPGAFSVIMLLTMERGKNIDQIAIVQIIRVIILVIALPLLFGDSSVEAGRESASPMPFDLGAMIAVCALAGWIGFKAKLPGAWIIAPMIASAFLHGSEINTANLPDWLWNICVAASGTMIGTRLSGLSRQAFVKTLVLALVLFAVTLCTAILVAGLVSWSLDLSFPQVLLAFAPGGLEAMVILSIILDLDPAYVGVHHVVRFLFIGLMLPIGLRWIESRASD